MLKINENVLNNILDKFLDDCANAIKDEAKRIVPVKTGNLQNSIEIRDKNYVEKSALIGSSLPYSLFVEMGTIKMRKQPFLRPALDNLGNIRK